MRVSSHPLNLSGPTESELRTSLSTTNKLSDVLNNNLDATTVGKQDELKETFQDFVGQTFFGQMIASMRSTQNDPPYFHGGRAEKIFQGQLDQVLSEELSDSSAAQFSEPMFKLFQLHRH